jgi:hypothetical protein
MVPNPPSHPMGSIMLIHLCRCRSPLDHDSPQLIFQTAVFDDLAQEALTTCRRSLTHGSELLGTKKDKAIDGRLFLVRHLLILKEMTAGLQLGRRDRTKDWAGITGVSLSPPTQERTYTDVQIS